MQPILMNSREAAAKLAAVVDPAQTKQNRTKLFNYVEEPWLLKGKENGVWCLVLFCFVVCLFSCFTNL